MTKLNIAAARSIMTAATTFKQFALAAEATWPVQQSSSEYAPLTEAYSAAKKAVIQDGAKTINQPLPKATKTTKAKAKGAKVSFKPKGKAAKVGKPTTKKEAADVVTLTEAEKEAIEAEVRSHTIRPCGCGCGVETKASFLPGHDAKLRSRLISEAKARKAKS